MSKLLIGSLVGGIILFLWQFMSWQALNIHGNEMQYTPNQEAIMECLNANLTEGGGYFIPRAPAGVTAEEEMAIYENSIGKPWAIINYHKSMEMSMGMNMFRGFVVDFVAILLLCWVLMKIPDLDFKTVLLSTLAIGAIAYLTIPYLNSIWFEGDTTAYIIDLIVSWGIVGAWLGWWLNR